MEVQGLRGEIQQLRGEIQQVRGEIQQVRDELRGEIQQVRDELSAQIRRLDDRLRAVEVTVAKIQQHLPIAGRVLPSPPPAAQPGAGGRPEMVRPPAEPAE